jgi:hypothetical protein
LSGQADEPVFSGDTQGEQTSIVNPGSGFVDNANAGSDGIEGEVLAPEEGSTLGSKLLTGAAIGLGVLVLGAMVSDPEPPANAKESARRSSDRNKRSSSARPNYPLLPQWLFEIDQIRQNTAEEKRSLSAKSWDGVRKETDAIILLGHLVKREVAIKATGLLGHEALVYLVLRKKAFLKASTGWFSDKVNYTPVEATDEEDAEKLAANIENELSGMPLWAQFVSGTETNSLRNAIEEILAYHEEQRKLAERRVDEARAGVSWRSRKSPKPGEAFYDSIARECRQVIYRSEDIEKAGRSALSALDAGQVVPARAFTAKHHKAKASTY